MRVKDLEKVRKKDDESNKEKIFKKEVKTKIIFKRNVQRYFTSRILQRTGLNGLSYFGRLKLLNLEALEKKKDSSVVFIP